MTEVPPWLFSASQIETFISCERKWAWGKLEGLTPPSTESQGLGTRVHAQIEAYVTDGTPLNLTTDEGKIALTGAHLWPRDRGYLAEAVFCIQLAGHWIWGMHDLILPGEVPEVTDHKTTKSFGFAPTPEELPERVQPAIYAFAGMKLAKVDRVKLRWIYYSTKPPFRLPAFPVIKEVSLSEIVPTLTKVVDAADRMRDLVTRPKRPRALDLAPSPAHCNAYNGCAYINLCNLSPADHLIATVTQGVVMTQANAAATQNAFLARLKAEAEAASAPGINPPAPPGLPPMPVQMPTPPQLPPGAIDPATVPGLPPPAAGMFWAIVNNAYAQLPIPVAPPVPAPPPALPLPLPPPAPPVIPAFAQSPAAMAAVTPQPQAPQAAAPKRRGRPPKVQPTGTITPEAAATENEARRELVHEALDVLLDALGIA